ncbi:hypothetical protein E1B28_000077 [Marasmius oreades]|uniref:DUF6534 domain-containing protein n=1 Tax=Marasmius oreades TaxID=181124 RepID=A0A9P7V0N2_9AGAR|nr:uncharacterized protein E1B28_000077 [Marasmius oreades]KAG7098103.1 hypothetical protein E1B28_000077 [Marasmius oreades]
MAPTNPAAIAHGWMFIGTIFNVCMMGVIIMQNYLYFVTFRHRDPSWLKSLVAFVFFANLLNTGFVTADLYLALVTNYMNPTFLGVSTWLFDTDPVIVGLIAGSIQLFFSWRVKVLTGKLYLGLITAGLALSQIICAMLMAWKCRQYPAWGDFAKFTDLIYAWMISTILVDVVITVILVWYLVRIVPLNRGHKTGMARSDELVDRIIRITIQTGALTSVWALVDLVTFLAIPDQAVHLVFQVSMVKLYTHSLMSSLNSRGVWIGRNETSGINTTAKMGGDTTARANVSSGGKIPSQVTVRVERHEMTDAINKPVDTIMGQEMDMDMKDPNWGSRAV